MSKYTTELRWPIEQLLDDLKLKHDETNWPAIYSCLGLADYPIYDETHRQELNNKIIRHFYVREIGFETFGLFKFYLRSRMLEIMPYFNQLYKFMDEEFNPLATWDMTYTDDWTVNTDTDTDRKDTWKSTNNSTEKTDTSSNDRTVFQDTPMSMLDNPGDNPVKNLQYATNVTYDDGTGSTTFSTNGNGSGGNNRDEKVDKDEIGNRKRRETGFKEPIVDLWKRWKDAMMNVDLMILDELETLFMGIG